MTNNNISTNGELKKSNDQLQAPTDETTEPIQSIQPVQSNEPTLSSVNNYTSSDVETKEHFEGSEVHKKHLLTTSNTNLQN